MFTRSVARRCVAQLNSSSSISSLSAPSVSKRNVSQRRIDLEMKNPYDMVEEYRKRMASVAPSLDDDATDYQRVYELYNVVEEKNAKKYEALAAKGKFPMDEIMAEEPTVKEYIDWVKAGKPKEGEWNSKTSKRTGIIGVKMGMLAVFDEYYQRIPLTAIYVPNCQVIQRKIAEKDGYYAMQIGAGDVALTKVTRPMMGHFAKAGVHPKHALTECRVTQECLLPEGTELTARHFTPGQYVDVTGISTGKGFQGAMKRWGFGGLRATHGVSVTHRSLGSTGNKGMCKVFKGKKMHGKMGNDQVTQRNNYLYMIDVKRNVLFIKGSIPGPKGNYVLIRDAERMMPQNPPFPTYLPTAEENIEALSDEQAIIKAKRPVPTEWKLTDLSEEEIWKQLTPLVNEIQNQEKLKAKQQKK